MISPIVTIVFCINLALVVGFTAFGTLKTIFLWCRMSGKQLYDRSNALPEQGTLSHESPGHPEVSVSVPFSTQSLVLILFPTPEEEVHGPYFQSVHTWRVRRVKTRQESSENIIPSIPGQGGRTSSHSRVSDESSGDKSSQFELSVKTLFCTSWQVLVWTFRPDPQVDWHEPPTHVFHSIHMKGMFFSAKVQFKS